MERIRPPETGPCECKYKLNCHYVRQHVTTEAKKEIPDYQCSFYGYFEEDVLKRGEQHAQRPDNRST